MHLVENRKAIANNLRLGPKSNHFVSTFLVFFTDGRGYPAANEAGEDADPRFHLYHGFAKVSHCYRVGGKNPRLAVFFFP